MNTYFTKFISFFFFVSFFVSCNKKDTDPLPPEPTPPDEKPLPAWDHSKTAVVYFISTLKDTQLGVNEGDYEAIAAAVKDTAAYAVALLDRCDVNTSSNLNGLSIAAANTGLLPLFALNKYSGNVAEGTGILIKNTILKQDDYPITDGCRIKTLNTFVNASTPFPVATVRMVNDTDVADANGTLAKVINDNNVVIGTITTAQFDKLKQKVQTIRNTYRIEKVSQNTDGYTIFYLSPRYWVLREVLSANVNSQVQSFRMSIEANVF